MSRRLVGQLVEVGAGAIHVRVDGPADASETLVLLHGFAGSLHWFDRVTRLLADSYRVVRLDLLGHGCSPRPNQGYCPEDQARMVEQVLAELEVKQATVVGHSMGAAVAVALAERSTRAAALVLINEGPAYTAATLPATNHLLLVPVVGDVLTRRPPEILSRQAIGRAFAPGFRQQSAFDDPAQPLLDARIPHSAFREAQLSTMRFMAAKALDERLLDLGLRTLVVWGAQDQLWRTDESTARYRMVPDTRVEVIETAGHSPQVETPSAVARLISDFVDPAP